MTRIICQLLIQECLQDIKVMLSILINQNAHNVRPDIN